MSTDNIRVLVWQWGRRGAGPRVAVEMAAGLDAQPGCRALLSLSTGAEILAEPDALLPALPVPTYRSLAGYLARLLGVRARRRWLQQQVAALQVDVAVCAMPGPLDLELAAVLKRLRIPFLVVVHDADRHPGDGSTMQMVLQRRLVARADGLVALTRHVGDRLIQQGVVGARPLLRTSLPPFVFGPPPAPPLAHGGRLRLLCFGRLLPYKGLDLLADALAPPGLADRLLVRVVGQGPDSPELARLAATDGVQLENRWVPEAEIGALIAWADAVILPYREASQSGIAATAIAAQRWVVATRVGGLEEQVGSWSRAILCSPEAAGLRQAIETLLNDPPALPAAGGDPRLAWNAQAGQLLDDVRTRVLGRGLARAPPEPATRPAVEPAASIAPDAARPVSWRRALRLSRQRAFRHKP